MPFRIERLKQDSTTTSRGGNFTWPQTRHRGIETITYGRGGHASITGEVWANAAKSSAPWACEVGIDGRERGSAPGGCSRGDARGDCTAPAVGEPAVALKMNGPRSYPGPSRAAEDSGHRHGRLQSVRVVCGAFWGRRGPVEGRCRQTHRYLDAGAPAAAQGLPVETERHAFAICFEGYGTFSSDVGAVRWLERNGAAGRERKV